jgi:hypothetical protein
MQRRTFGIGTLSLPIIVMGIVWGFTFYGVCVGDNILNYIGLKAWTNGDTGIHLTVYYSLIFYICAFAIAVKYKNDIGAKLGKIISMVIGSIIILSIFGLAI